MKPKRILSFLLATAMTISLLPTFTLTASAGETPTTTTEKNITLDTSALSGYDSTNGYKYVYYGTYGGKPIKWRILSMNGNDGTYYESTPYEPTTPPDSADLEDGKVYTDDDNTEFIYLAKNNEYYKKSASAPMFLLSEYGLEKMAYDSDGTMNNGQTYVSDWRYSDAWNWCNDTTDGTSFIRSSFTASEKAYFLKTSKDNARLSYTDELKGDTFFFLSEAEAIDICNECQNLRAYMAASPNGSAVWWWLRSPDFNYDVYCVNVYGYIDFSDVRNGDPAARPAFNLNRSSVLFTSAAKGGKSSTAAAGGGAGIFENVDLSTLEGNDGYKLTMLDESRKDFSASLKSLSGNTAKVSYSGAKTGTTETKEYISVIIKNENDVKYYGRACEVSSASGEVYITLPSDFNEANGDLLCVFNEQINGDYKTDYASNFVTVVTTETGLKNAVKSNGTVVLGKDITISETLEIDKNVILDLAGFTLTKESAAKTDYGVIKVNENTNFTLKDSSTAQTGKITGGNANKGGGVYVDSDSTFVMEGGTISGCEASYCGGVYVDSDSTFVMEGGTITDCTASSYLKAVVKVNGGATFNMKGGIIYCSNENDAVFVDSDATVKNDSQTSATVCYGGIINILGDRSGNSIYFNDKKLYAGELIPNTGRVVMPEEPEKAGYSFDGWYTKDGTNNGDWGDEFTLETTVTKNTNLFAKWTPIPAEEPTVSGSDVEVTYGSYTDKTISVAVTNKDEDTYSYSYQWKDSSENAITGATKNTYTIPNDLAVGSYDYYCTVTAKRKDNGETETTEKTITVKVDKAGSETTVTPSTTVVTYGETLTLTAEVEKNSKSKTVAVDDDKVVFYLSGTEEVLGEVIVDYDDNTKKDKGKAELNINTTDRKLAIGSNTIVAEYGGSVNLNGSGSNAITVTLEKKTVGLTWEDCDNLVYNGNPKTVSATATEIEASDGKIGVTVKDGDKTNAGSYTATATALTGTYAEYYKLPSEKTKSYNIKSLQIQVEWSMPQSFEYDGTSKNVTATVKNKVSSDNLVLTYKDNEKTDAGNYTAEITGIDNNNYTLGTNNQALKQSWSITKAKSSVTTSPTANTLTYNGTAQELVTSGTAKGGTLKYSLNNVDWTETIPTGTDATSYEVWYKVVGDNNHNDTTADKVDVTIAKKSIADATVALDGELTYNGQLQTQNVVLTLDGFSNVTFDVSDNEQKDVKTDGDYTLTVTGTGNFTGIKTLDWNIKPYTPAENPNKKTTARVRRGRTLADATVTEGEMLGLNDIVLEGTFAWGDDTKTMSADGTEQMTFTPTNTNYAPITINVAVSTYSSGGGGTSRYTVKFDTDGGNTITNQTVTKNSKATEPTEPTKEGYIFDGWYTDSEFTTEYDFDTKVTKNITLYAKWVEDEVQEPSGDKKDDEQKPSENEWKNPFADVTKDDWFFDNVRYANENGLMSGTTDTTFAPNDNLTRGMLVTVLWRADGEPVVNYAMPFTDIIDTAYYAEAVRWAASENIVNGVTETEFAPDMNITREQIAAIIYRYAKFKGYDVSVGEDTNILSYTDFDEISEYAIEAMQYAVGMGLMKGKTESTLNPKDNATRAEIAAILNRFIESNK